VRQRRVDALDVALGEFRPEDEAAVARRLREDHGLREEVERLAPVVARLERQPADTWHAPDPPPLVVGAPLRGTGGRRGRAALSLRPAVAVAVSLAFVAAGVAGGVLLSDDDGPLPGRELALAPLEGGGQGRAVLAEQDAGRVELDVRGLAPDRSGAYHELWLLPDGGRGAPVAIGRFRVGEDGRARVTFRLSEDPGRYRFLDVSVEPPDGDPGHSGRSVLRGALSDA
jgi:anti-sigma-K factor RskA